MTDLAANRFDRILQEPRHRPIAAAAADVQHEIAEHGFTMLGVIHFGVILESVASAFLVGDRGVSMSGAVVVVRHADFAESLTHGNDRVLVAHPYGLMRGK